MNKAIKISILALNICVWLLSTQYLYALNQGNSVNFIIIAQDNATIGEPIDLIIRAVDENGQLATSFSWSVIFNTDNVGDIVPSPGKTIPFTTDKKGEMIFSKWLVFNKSGKQKLYVSDISVDIIGEKTFNVASSSEANNTLISSSSGTTNPFMTMGSTQNSSSSGALFSEIESINESIKGAISFDSAPIIPELPLESAYNMFTAWEIMHRTPMLAGFMWIGEIANFITPAMYIGTPFADSREYNGAENPFAADISDDPTTYAECIQHQAYLSFGLGERVSDSDMKELKLIAKSCASEFYGSYFSGKEYTTHEEFLMMMFTMFSEPIELEWEFTEEGDFVSSSEDKNSNWYDPFVAFAQDLQLFPAQSENWKVAEEITDSEIIEAISLYTAYRMEYEWSDKLDRGMIETENMNYNIAFPEDEWLVIRVQ